MIGKRKVLFLVKSVKIKDKIELAQTFASICTKGKKSNGFFFF
ncbi:MAG: hypothetical protein ACJAWV_002852 [Flammeovirgaceae bacterium]|jgi:hypothetical protein